MHFTLLEKVGIPNKNGRLYPKEIFERYGKLKIPVVLNNQKPNYVNVDTIAGYGVIDKIKENGEVLIDLTSVNSPNGKILEELMNNSNNIEISLFGSGKLKDIDDWISKILGKKEIVIDFKLSGLSVNYKE